MLLLQPTLFLLGILGALLVVMRVRIVSEYPQTHAGRRLLSSIAWFVLLFLTLLMTQNPKNMRLLSPFLIPMSLLAAALIWAVLSWCRARLARIHPLLGYGCIFAGAIGVVFSAILDVNRFVHYFIISGVPDLSTPWFLQVPR